MDTEKITLKTLILVVFISFLAELILLSGAYFAFVAAPAQKAAREATERMNELNAQYEKISKLATTMQTDMLTYQTQVNTEIDTFKKNVVTQLEYMGFTKRKK